MGNTWGASLSVSHDGLGAKITEQMARDRVHIFSRELGAPFSGLGAILKIQENATLNSSSM